MDPKRKRIYLIIIVVCIVASAGLLLFGRFGGGGAPSSTPITAPNSTGQPLVSKGVTGDSKTGFSAPSVFPDSPNFDFSVLDSSNFKQLRSYNAVQNLPSELGREDPFKSY